MATKAIPTTEAEKGNPGVEEVTVVVPGAGTVTTYFKIEHVDDLTGKPEDGIETIRLSVPVEAERETVETDAEGDPLKNSDGTDKIKVEKFIDYEMREIDLGPASRTKLFKALASFYEASREVTKAQPSAGIRTRTAGGGSSEVSDWNRRVKAWLEKNRPELGITSSTRGRLSKDHEKIYITNNPNDPKP